MHGYASDGRLKPLKGNRISVMLLGRYRDDRPADLTQWKERFRDKLNIEFRTVHSSKGLEAEYVFILNVVQGTRGFPSQIQDDPALQLAMPAPDPYPYAEERRLFYVAMTRARKQVRFYTTLAEPSQFLIELARNEHVTLEPVDGEPLEPCPKCENGVLRLKPGKHGAFHGCNRFPACDYTRAATDQEAAALKTGMDQSNRISGPVKVGDSCPVCKQGVLQQRKGRLGPFIGCSRYRAGCMATSNISFSSDS
jgi:DNA helicase-4